MKKLGAYCIIILSTLVLACTGSDRTNRTTESTLSKDTIKNQKPTDTIGEEETINTIALEILTTLKAKDYKAFAAYFHPTEGVVFSPYGFIDTKTSKKMTKATFLKLIEEHGSVIWGSYDGSGETIRLTAQQYLDKFVYNADYINAEKTAYNQIIGKGNSINNLNEIFPQYPFVEYYFSGFDEKHEGMDWTSLRLVFKPHQGTYFLVAIVHDQWTT